MKACPICQSTYEDWIEFCFNDGVPLVAYEPKPPPPRASAPRPPVSAPSASTSSYDAPEARLVSGADLPEPVNLSRFAAPVAPPVVAPPVAAPVSPVSAPPVAVPAAPVAAAPDEVAAAAEIAPEPQAVAAVAPVEPAAPAPVDEERTAPAHVAAPTPSAALAPPPIVLPPVVLPAPIVSASGTIVPMPAPSPTSASPAADFDADAMSDLASAFQAPSGPADPPAGGAPPVKFHAPLAAESEDGKATVPMYTAYPADPPAGRSVLDDEPARKKGGGAGIGVALLGMLALGAFLLVAAVGLWWTMSSGGEPTASREPAPVESTKVLPAAAEPAPVVPVEAVPVEAAPVEAAVEPVAAAAPAATTTTTAAPVSRTTTTTTTTTSRGTTTGATAATPRDTPPAAPSGTRGGTTSPVTADAGPSSVTSDSVWGTPTAPTSGFLRIVTDPDGATVYVNEAAKGKTPVTIELPYGAHQVRVVRAGYKTEVRDVNIRVRELTVPFNLKPDVVTGQVNVYGPDGFRVVVDGHDMGPMPVTVQVSEGVRQFKLVGTDGSTCNLPKEIKFKAVGRPETITLACP
jgi:hypothetical protein